MQTACYAGLLLAPAEGFGQGFFCPSGKKREPIFGKFFGPVTFSSNLSNFERNSQKHQKKSKKSPKISKISKNSKSKKNQEIQKIQNNPKKIQKI